MDNYRDLREYINALEAAGKLWRISKPVNKDTELAPLVRLQHRGLDEDECRAFLFEKVIGSNGRQYSGAVAIGVLALTTTIFSLGMNCEPTEIASRLASATRNPIRPVKVSSGPVQEEVHTGGSLLEHDGLGEFPIPIATPGFDPAPYITAPYFVSRDPENGIHNVGMYRAMVKSPGRVGVNFYHSRQGGAIHWEKSRRTGRPLHAAIVIGGPPSLGYCAASQLPVDCDEYAVAGAISGFPLEMVKCKTVDLDVPANAEIVIEGFMPTDVQEIEAPFGETNGFIGLPEIRPFFNVSCITHRRNPVWLATLAQYPPSESTKIRQFAAEAELLRKLREISGFDEVLEVSYFQDVTGLIAVIRVDDNGSKRAAEILSAGCKYSPVRILIAVSKDVNIRDMRSVFLAVATRTQPYRDYRIEMYPAMALSDYSLAPMDKLEKQLITDIRPQSSTLLIDATMKWPLPPVSLPKKEYMMNAMRIWKELGLPALKLVEPWSGVNLGYWTEEHERHARAAVSGDYYMAGEDYRKQRKKP